MDNKNLYVRVPKIFLVLLSLLAVISTVIVVTEGAPRPHIVMGPVQFESDVIDMALAREKVKCKFNPPLKYVTLINHWFDNNEDMYADYILRAEPNDQEEIWGWSNCVWQPDDNAAWCDIYAVIPEYVTADMNMDTIGHENVHAACGNYHE